MCRRKLVCMLIFHCTLWCTVSMPGVSRYTTLRKCWLMHPGTRLGLQWSVMVCWWSELALSSTLQKHMQTVNRRWSFQQRPPEDQCCQVFKNIATQHAQFAIQVWFCYAKIESKLFPVYSSFHTYILIWIWADDPCMVKHAIFWI